MLRVSNETYDVISENFDGFFEQRVRSLTEQQKASLPRKLMIKLYRKGGVIRSFLNTSRLNILEKIFVLFRALKSRWFIIVEDENGGGFEEWEEFRKEVKKKEISEVNAKRTINEGHFFLGSKELCDAFSYKNDLSASPAYKYLIGAKNSKGIAEWRTQRRYISKFITNYEFQKKKFLVNNGLFVAEWYMLVALYNDIEIPSSKLYKEVFQYSFGGSHIQFKRAMINLQSKGMIVKHGNTSSTKIRITPTGSDMVNQIVSKHIINF